MIVPQGMAMRALFIMLFLLSVLASQAQYIYRNYNTIDGMPSSTVYSCTQDSAGFLWFATDKGLCRFDGSDFLDFENSDYEEDNLTTTTVMMNGNQVIASNYGGFITINDLMQTHKTGLVFGNVDYASYRLACHNGFVYYRTMDGHVAAYDLKLRRKHNIGNQDIEKPFALTKSNNGNIYYGQHGLYKIQGLTSMRVNNPLLNNKEITNLSVDWENNLWISCEDIVYKMKNDAVIDSVKCDFYTNNALFVSNSRIYGLVIYDQYGHGNKGYHDLTTLLNSGNTCIITTMFEDRDANLWINTYNKGSYCILNSYISTFSGKSEVYDASIHDVYVNEQQETYMATSLGIVFKNGTEFRRLGNARQQFYYTIEKVGNNLLVAVAKNDADKLEKIYDKALGKTFSQMTSRRLCVMNDSVIVYNKWKNSVTVASIDINKSIVKITGTIKLDSSVRRCTAIFKKDRSHVIVSTTDACYMVDLENNTSVRMQQIRSKVNDIVKDASGTIYLASEAGLYVLKHNRIHLVREANGLPLKNLSALAIDGSDRLWIGYGKGLLVWKGHFMKRISGSPYMRSHEINKLFYEKTFNKLYVATNSGLSIIDITKMDSSATKKVGIIILKVQSGDSIYNSKHPINLIPGNGDIDIYFSAIDVSNPQGLYFRYTLNNGSSWTMINARKISLRGLGYGAQEVQIQASTDGVSWGKAAGVKFHVDYPFYTTLRFWVRLIIVLGLIVFFLVKMRIRRIREKATKDVEMQQKMEDLRYEALSAAVNPHFIFNTLGAIQSFVINRDPFQASDYIAKFARLIRITLNHAGEKYIGIEEEINRLALYLELEKLRCGDKLEYNIQIDASVDRFKTIPNMIIQPLLENAILHGILPLRSGLFGKLEVLMTQDEHFLTIQVRDNGVGINRHEHSKHGYVSIGIDNLQERLQMVKGSGFMIKNLRESVPNERGTLVEIKLPV